MSKTTTHTGSHTNILPSSSPGLLFLKRFIPAIDTLSPPFDQCLQYMTSDAVFSINGADPVPATSVTQAFEARSQMLSSFGHELHMAWDVEVEEGRGARQVIFESTSTSEFVEGEPKVLKVREMSVVELVLEDGELRATSVRSYLDFSKFARRGKEETE